MILHVWRFNVVPGKQDEAEEHMLKWVAYHNQVHPTVNQKVLKNVNGLTHQLHLIGTYESIDASRAVFAAFRDDPTWSELVEESQGLVDYGSLESHYFDILGP